MAQAPPRPTTVRGSGSQERYPQPNMGYSGAQPLTHVERSDLGVSDGLYHPPGYDRKLLNLIFEGSFTIGTIGP